MGDNKNGFLRLAPGFLELLPSFWFVDPTTSFDKFLPHFAQTGDKVLKTVFSFIVINGGAK